MSRIYILCAVSAVLSLFALSGSGASAETVVIKPKVPTPKVTVQPKDVQTPQNTLNPQPLPPVHNPDPPPSDRTMK